MLTGASCTVQQLNCCGERRSDFVYGWIEMELIPVPSAKVDMLFGELS
jgi:hypothetical protein